MPRVPVSYEQVAAVANALVTQGIPNPITKQIRAELAKRAGPGAPVGSPNTIQRHLDAWRARDRPLEPDLVPALPDQLTADLLRALNVTAQLARAPVEEKLAQARSELEDLTATGEALEARADELSQDLAARTSERDSMAGQLADRTAEAQELKAGLANATNRVSMLERDLHTAQAAAQAAEGRVDEIRAASERQSERFEGELSKARAAEAVSTKRAIDAEKIAVGAQAHLDGERSAKAALVAQVADLQRRLQQLDAEAARAAAAEAAAAGLRDQVGLLTETNTMLRAMVPKAAGGT